MSDSFVKARSVAARSPKRARAIGCSASQVGSDVLMLDGRLSLVSL